MPSKTLAKVAPKDVAEIEALEPVVRAFVEAIHEAQPAFKRLGAARYPGAERVNNGLQDLIGEGDSSPSIEWLMECFELYRMGAGDQAAYDYYHYVVKDGLTIAEAAAELIDCYGDERALARIDGLRRYAAQVRP